MTMTKVKETNKCQCLLIVRRTELPSWRKLFQEKSDHSLLSILIQLCQRSSQSILQDMHVSSKFLTSIRSNMNSSLGNTSFHCFKRCVTVLSLLLTPDSSFVRFVWVVAVFEIFRMKCRKNCNSPTKLRTSATDFSFGYSCKNVNLFWVYLDAIFTNKYAKRVSFSFGKLIFHGEAYS